jgi:hypothetical protein
VLDKPGSRGLLASCLHMGHRRLELSHWSTQVLRVHHKLRHAFASVLVQVLFKITAGRRNNTPWSSDTEKSDNRKGTQVHGQGEHARPAHMWKRC